MMIIILTLLEAKPHLMIMMKVMQMINTMIIIMTMMIIINSDDEYIDPA